jgi:hypothetical protein
LDLQNSLVVYQKELQELGIHDYQVPGLDHENVDTQFQGIQGDQILKEI